MIIFEVPCVFHTFLWISELSLGKPKASCWVAQIWGQGLYHFLSYPHILYNCDSHNLSNLYHELPCVFHSIFRDVSGLSLDKV